jgi:hypothetical protein
MKKLLMLFFIFSACSKPQMDDCITSLGKEKSETRVVDSFTKLYVEDRIEVTLIQDSTKVGRIELFGPGNILGQIASEVEEGKLRLLNRNTCNFVRSFNYSLKANVYVADLELLEIESIATVNTLDTLHLTSLSIYHNALSDIDLTLDCKQDVYVQSLNSATTVLHGRAKTLKGSIEEITILDARDLVCEEVLLDLHSPLDSYVNATKGLFAKIFNSGNLYYTQEPTDYKELNIRRSSGNLILLK